MTIKGTVALVGGAQLPEVRRAVARRGLRAVAVNDAETMESIPDEPVIVERVVIDYANPLLVVRRLTGLGKRFRLAAVVPLSEYGMLPGTLAAGQLGLPAQAVRVVRETRDKLRMRRVVERAGLPQPRYAACATEAQAADFLAEVGAPIIVKPAWGTGSEGVARVDRSENLPAAFEMARDARSGGPLLCEELVDGPEVSLEACTVGGRFVPLALTDKLTGTGFMEIGHQQPSSHPAAVQEEVLDYAGRVLAALGIDDAVTHSEFRLTSHGPMLIETHSRMGGGDIHVLTERTTGVDMADLMVGLSLGEHPAPAPRSTGRACAVRFLLGGPGVVEAVEVREPGAGSGIELSHVRVKPGDHVGSCRSSLDRLGRVVAVGETAAAASRAAEGQLERVRISWREERLERRAS